MPIGNRLECSPLGVSDAASPLVVAAGCDVRTAVALTSSLGGAQVSVAPPSTGASAVAALCMNRGAAMLVLGLDDDDLDVAGTLELVQPAVVLGGMSILVVADRADGAAARRALAMGANACVARTLGDEGVAARAARLLEVWLLQHSDTDEPMLEEVAQHVAVSVFPGTSAGGVDSGPFEDADHLHRVGALSARVAEVLGMSAPAVRAVRRAAPFHDVGKLAIAASILGKAGALTAAETATMRSHTLLGAAILKRCDEPSARTAQAIALTHHEHWDGGGYPHGLLRHEIPLGARIVAVVDVFDALLHERPYKPAWPLQGALGEVRARAGLQFDPAVVEALLKALRGTGGGSSATLRRHERCQLIAGTARAIERGIRSCAVGVGF